MLSRGPIRYARNGDVSIAYTVIGDGPVDVLFIGGFISHLEIGLELALAERFWERMGSFARVITFDKRGMGLSDRDGGAYALENIVDDALVVLDACGVRRAAVVGVSEGGSAATLMAATHPERVSAMVQYGTYARVSRAGDYPEGVPVEVARRFWSRMIDQWGDPVSIDVWAPSAANDPELREWWARMLRSGVSPGAMRAIGLMYEDLDVRPLLPAVRVPTLILYRAGDRVVAPALSRAVARGILGAREVELDGVDHLFLAGDQDAMLDEIEEFLTGRPAVAAGDRVLATVLFADIVASTEVATELGDRRWRDLLGQFERLVAFLVGLFGGLGGGGGGGHPRPRGEVDRRRRAGDLRWAGPSRPGGAFDGRGGEGVRARAASGRPHGRVRAGGRGRHRDRRAPDRAGDGSRGAGRGPCHGHGQGPRRRVRAGVREPRNPRARGSARRLDAARCDR